MSTGLEDQLTDLAVDDTAYIYAWKLPWVLNSDLENEGDEDDVSRTLFLVKCGLAGLKADAKKAPWSQFLIRMQTECLGNNGNEIAKAVALYSDTVVVPIVPGFSGMLSNAPDNMKSYEAVRSACYNNPDIFSHLLFVLPCKRVNLEDRERFAQRLLGLPVPGNFIRKACENSVPKVDHSKLTFTEMVVSTETTCNRVREVFRADGQFGWTKFVTTLSKNIIYRIIPNVQVYAMIQPNEKEHQGVDRKIAVFLDDPDNEDESEGEDTGDHDISSISNLSEVETQEDVASSAAD